MTKAKLIVFEGLDGSGKSSTAKSVAESIGAIFMTTPSSSIRKYRDEIIAGLGTSQEAHQMFYLATVFSASQEIQTHLREGRSVVLDRYFLSTQAYAKFRGSQLDLDALNELLQPADVTIYLDLPLSERHERLRKRGGTEADWQTVGVHADEQLHQGHLCREGLAVMGDFHHVQVRGGENLSQVVERVLVLVE